MTEAAIEEAQRLLRIAKAGFAACRALTRQALIATVEPILDWVAVELNSSSV